MSHVVASFYAHLAQSNEVVPASVTDAIFRHATAHKDESLLATLARRLDVSPETLSSLGKLKPAKIRAAYLSRSDRPESELLEALRCEKRVTVLAAMASSEDASEGLLDALSQLTHPKVAVALVNNEKCTPAALGRAVLTLTCESANLSYHNQYKVREILEGRTELHSAVALRSTSSSWALQLVATSDHITHEAREAFIQQRILEPFRASLKDPNQTGWETKTTQRTLTSQIFTLLSSENYTLEQALALGDFLRKEANLEKQTLAQVETALAARGLGDDKLTRNLTLARTSSDVKELAELTNEMLDAITTAATQLPQQRSWGPRSLAPGIVACATALIGNASVPSQSAIALLAATRTRTNIGVTLARPDDVEFTSTALALDPYSIAAPAVLSYLRGHRKTLLALLAHLNQGSVNMNANYVVAHVCSAGLIDVSMVRDLPWWILTDSSSSFAQARQSTDGENSGVDITAVVTELLAEELGDDTSLWEVFSVVGEDFQGTIGDLLDLCRMTQSAS